MGSYGNSVVWEIIFLSKTVNSVFLSYTILRFVYFFLFLFIYRDIKRLPRLLNLPALSIVYFGLSNLVRMLLSLKWLSGFNIVLCFVLLLKLERFLTKEIALQVQA